MSIQLNSRDSEKVNSRLKYWGQQLYDLSGRNRLLFYRDTKSSTATILEPDFKRLFETLVEKGAELSVPLPTRREMIPQELLLDESELAELGQGAVNPDEAPINEQELFTEEANQQEVESEQHGSDIDEIESEPSSNTKARQLKKREILTNHSVPVLNRVMYNLRYLSRTVQEEQGFNILYATFGMLKWREIRDSGFSYAPLILVPLLINRENPNSSYKLRMAEEDIVVNPVLQLKLARDFGFHLPEVTNELSTEQLDEFLSIIRKKIQKFEGWSIDEKTTIGAFNFLTLLLIKDFEKYSDLYGEHPFVQVLSGVKTVEIPMPADVPQARELDDLVDPSNVYQVLDADSSQQEAIEAAKRGLSFVLQGPPGTGKSQTIANIIVESMMAGKKVLFVSQKMAALEVVQNRLDSKGLREFCLEVHNHKMDKRKVVRDLMTSLSHSPLHVRNPEYKVQQKELKQIRDELNSYVRQLHEPRFELGLSLYQAQGRLSQCLDAPVLNFSISALETLSAETLGRMFALVREVSSYPNIIENYEHTRWQGYNRFENSLEEREHIAAQFEVTVDAIESLEQGIRAIVSVYKLPPPETIQDCLDYLFVFTHFQPKIFSPESQNIIDEYAHMNPSFTKFLKNQYLEDASKLQAMGRPGVSLTSEDIAEGLWLVKKIGKRRVLRLFESSADYSNELGDLSMLEEMGAHVVKGFDLALSLFSDRRPGSLAKELEQTPAEAADWFSDAGAHTGELAEWSNFNKVRSECNEAGLADFVDKAIGLKLPPEKWEKAFSRRLHVLFIDKLTADRPLLQKFRGTTQAELIRRFRILDLTTIENSSYEIKHKLYKNKPEWSWMDAGSAETSILRREANKKRRLMPMRKLFLETPNLIQALKPCMMMSPLTVCQLLDPSVYQFDIALFDEASQIPPEYAVSAFLRAKQVIVAGDSQQLPPTNFFQSLEVGDMENEAQDDVVSFESILDVCDGCGFPNKMLNWHYRSRDESLIAYSNYHFYDNRLYTFPNSSFDNPSTGLKFIYVPDGVYKSGSGARYNRKEAARVAELVYEHLLETPQLSLGVVAFSAPQRRMIEAEIEDLRLKYPGLNDLFSYDVAEPFFVKNLENVQGDERDVIILSVGYGRDASGKMPLNFGPINRDGGNRRLNVAVTRSRYMLKLVASIQPEDIDLTRAGSEGAQLLRNYLEAARDGIRAVYHEEKRRAQVEFESLFEESVFTALSERGLQVVPQVGVSQYRVDLAIVDPDDAGRFLLGIECDGPMYYSAMTARDRDRLRQQVLEGLGWKIHRIWSRDWIQNREAEIEKILHTVDVRKAELRSGGNVHELTAESSTQDRIRVLPSAAVDHPQTPPTAVPYQPTKLDLKLLGNGESLLDTSLSNIIDAFQAIANAEGPISINIAKKLVLDAWGTRRGKKIDDRLTSAIYRGQQEKAFTLNGNFLWPLEKRIAPLRIHVQGQPLRPITDIAPEEIEVAVREGVKGAITIGSEDLYRGVCKLFGLKATQENIARVENIVSAMLARDELKLENDKVSRA